jgi:hypothetical protein
MCLVADTRTVALVHLVHAKNGQQEFCLSPITKFGEKLAVTKGSGFDREGKEDEQQKGGRYDVEREFGLTA